MLTVKRGTSAFSRASSSRQVLASSSVLRRRFYADDGNQSASNRERYGRILGNTDSTDKNTLEDILSPQNARAPAPDRPPRFVDSRQPVGARVRPAALSGGANRAQLQFPQRSTRAATAEAEGPNDLNAAVSPSTSDVQDDADRKAQEVFKAGGSDKDKTKSIILTSVPYKLYVIARMKNCIMTLVNEHSRPVAVTSGGRCGFRNVAEGTYEAGYQCAIRMFEILQKEMELRKEGIRLEIFLNGFGHGRSALLKALTMSEGEGIRRIVERLTDNTPIKIGGVRLQKARRL